MTAAERKLANDLKNYDTVELHKYQSVNGHHYYKCKKDGRPLLLVRCSVFDRMERRVGLITGKNSLYTLNVEQLKANLLDWQTKQDAPKPVKKPRKARIVNDENIF